MKYFAVFALLCCLMGVALAQLKSPICGEEFAIAGPCRGLLPLYSYKQDKNECIMFNYSGCQGNLNRFDSKGECEQACKV